MSLFLKDIFVQFHALYHRLKRYSIFNLLKSVINKGQTNNTEVKYEATITAAIRHLTTAVVKGKLLL
jgi:hypothetical protein